eukprot:gene16946-12164_t
MRAGACDAEYGTPPARGGCQCSGTVRRHLAMLRPPPPPPP